MAIVDPLLLTEALPLEFPLRRLHGGLDRRGGGEHLGGGGVNGKTHIHHHDLIFDASLNIPNNHWLLLAIFF